CAESEKPAMTAKPPAAPAHPRVAYKVGDPYQIDGVWYYPTVDYNYDETGIASWYGPDFDGKDTALGEPYDMNDLTAAHRTLPMPSMVRVTKLENGRVLALRVNDRGPYAKGRILDVSRRGAQLLGFDANGTARVRVQIMAEESRLMAAQAQAGQPVALMPGETKPQAAPTPGLAAPAARRRARAGATRRGKAEAGGRRARAGGGGADRARRPGHPGAGPRDQSLHSGRRLHQPEQRRQAAGQAELDRHHQHHADPGRRPALLPRPHRTDCQRRPGRCDARQGGAQRRAAGTDHRRLTLRIAERHDCAIMVWQEKRK